MIKTLSSYYIDVPLVSPLTSLTCTSFVLKLYVWNGLKTDVPAEATYTLTENNPEALTDTLSVNVAKLINDFIEFEPQVLVPNIQNGNNQIWIRQEVYYTTENVSEASTPQLVDVNLGLKGYGYAMEGTNPQTPADKILLTNREFKVSRNSKFIVPIVIDEPTFPTAELTITNIALDTGNDYIVTFTSVGSYTNLFLNVVESGETIGYGIELDDVTSPQTVTLLNSGDFNYTLFGFDNDTAVNVTSAIYNFIN
jgi:hypothetical protein